MRRAQEVEDGRKVGPARAARELGVNYSSLRSALKRARDAPPLPPPASVAPEVDGDDALELLRQEIVGTRRAALDALGKTAGVAAQGLGSEARNLAVVHGSLSQRASDLEADLHRAEQHQAGLDDEQAELLQAVLAAMLDAFEAPRGGALALLAALLEQVDQGEAPTPPDELGARVRAELRARVRAEVRPEVRAEVLEELRGQAKDEKPAPSPAEAQLASERIYPSEPEQVEPAARARRDDLPPWDELPKAWRRHPRQRDLDRWEYARAVEREQIARRKPAPRPQSRWEQLQQRHPALGGPS
jgi:hypothetical protein